jgi:23S rRNA (uracil1939-C5)-methyltransferase
VSKSPRSAEKPKRGDVMSVSIEKLSVGGRGVARSDGLVIFVSDSAPGDIVEVEIVFVKKNFAEAQILRILTSSKHRLQPKCPVAGVCGGCNWQHLEYDEQLIQKRILVRESLNKFSGFDVTAEDRVQAVIPSPTPWRYRNRIQLHHGGGKLGFYKRGSHEIVDISDCVITEKDIADRFPQLRLQSSNHKPGRFEVFRSQSGEISTRGTELDQSPGHDGLSFSQVNTAQNENLIKVIVDSMARIIGDGSASRIYDLYSGSGNFTFPLAERWPEAHVIAVELNAEAALQAQKTISKNPLYKHIEFNQSDVAVYLNQKPLLKNSVVLLDPPRIGCAPEVMKAVANSGAKAVFYVSCHPVTLARDLKELAAAGYILDFVQPFDMFPQTDHVETLAVLSLP